MATIDSSDKNHALADQPQGTSAEESAFRQAFAERFIHALDRHEYIPRGHGRVAAVANLFGVNRVTVGKWMTGDGLPELWRLPQIARMLDVDANELVGLATSPMLIDDQYVSIGMHEQDNPEEVVPVFLQPSTLSGIGLPQGCFLMRISSTDMPKFASVGDLVIYNPSIKWFGTGSDVYVLSVNERYVLRRAVESLRGDIVLSTDDESSKETFSRNDFTGNHEQEPNKILIVGRVESRITRRGRSS